MKRPPLLLASTALGLLVVAVGSGCSFGESGIAPPTNRVFLPGGIVPDPDGSFLYVVNSNSDLRFNAGTVVAVDLDQASLVQRCAQDPNQAECQARAAQNPALGKQRPLCTKTRFSRTEPVPNDYCCRDLVDSNILNCNEPQFIQDDATIEIGSFGGAVELQSFARGEVSIRRLFMAVRAEPSITYADVTVTSDGSTSTVAMRCTGPHGQDAPAPPPNAFCDDNWRIRRPGGVTPGALVLPEEPHVLTIDNVHHALLIGHLTLSANAQLLGGGVSALDICDPEDDYPVRFAGLARTTFLPATLSQAVASLSPGDPFLPDTEVYVGARYSAAISGMVFKHTPDDPQHPGPNNSSDPEANHCDRSAARDLTLIPSEHFYSPAFLPNGADVRGILFSSDGSRAFVLHRNDVGSAANPAALAVLDRHPLPDGTPSNPPMGLLQVCNGPTAMQVRDVGSGDRIFVTCYDDGQIWVIDPVALMVTGIIDAGAGPISLVFSPRDKGIAYVASFANSHLSLIDLRPGSPTENRVLLRIGLPHGYGE